MPQQAIPIDGELVDKLIKLCGQSYERLEILSQQRVAELLQQNMQHARNDRERRRIRSEASAKWGISKGTLQKARHQNEISPGKLAVLLRLFEHAARANGQDVMSELSQLRAGSVVSPSAMSDVLNRNAQSITGRNEEGQSSLSGEINGSLATGDWRIAELSDVESWNWDGRRLLKELIDLDWRMFDDLDAESEGHVEQWSPVFDNHPETWRLLVTDEQRIVGYWHFVVLPDEEHRRATVGRLIEGHISAERVRPLTIGNYNMYFVSMGLLKSFRRPPYNAAILDSLYVVLTGLAENGVFFDEIITNAFTKYGVALCEDLGFSKVCEHEKKGAIYRVSFREMLRRRFFDRHPRLRQLYGV